MLNKVSQLSMPPVLPQLPEKWVLNEKVPLKESKESLRYLRQVGHAVVRHKEVTKCVSRRQRHRTRFYLHTMFL